MQDLLLAAASAAIAGYLDVGAVLRMMASMMTGATLSG